MTEINLLHCLFWNVDTQQDFISPEGKLYVQGAELLKTNLQRLTELAKENGIRVVNTADYHFEDSKELSDNPDFVSTFPPHCMANTVGASFIDETNPEKPLVFNWNKKHEINKEEINDSRNRNILIRKDAFDVFEGNPFTEEILNALSPKTVVVYGVTTNVCVDGAAVGLAKRVEKVFVVKDAIKELPKIPLPFEKWNELGIELISLKELEKRLGE